jgi:hypothetical protein
MQNMAQEMEDVKLRGDENDEWIDNGVEELRNERRSDYKRRITGELFCAPKARRDEGMAILGAGDIFISSLSGCRREALLG